MKFSPHAACFALVLTALTLAARDIVNGYPDPKYGTPLPFSKVSGTRGTLAVEIAGGKLYALEDGGLSIFDLTDPRNPQRLGRVAGMGNVRQLKVRGDTAFLSARQFGLWAVDVSDPRNPRILSNFDAVEMATGLDVVGDVAFLGNRVFGVQCVDVSDPRKMKHISSLVTYESQSVYYHDTHLFSGDWAGGEVTIIDASNLRELRILSKIALDGYGDGVHVRGNILFASTGQHKKSGPPKLRHGRGHGLEIFDISDPKKPVRLSRTTFPDIYFGPSDFWSPTLAGNYCFAGDTVNGLFVLEVSDLKAPRILGHLILPKRDPENPQIAVPYAQIAESKIPQGDAVASIAVGDNVVYIAGNYTGIYLAEFPGVTGGGGRDPGALPRVPAELWSGEEPGFVTSGAEPVNPTRAVAIRGDIAYTANVGDGVKIHRLSENKIEQIGRVPIPYAADVKRVGDRLYVAEGQRGIGVYRIVSDTQITEIGRLPILDNAFNFVQFLWAFEGSDIVAATCATSRIYFVDFSDVKAPKVVFSQAGTGLLYNNYAGQKLVDGRYFALSRTFGGLQVFDLEGNRPRMIWDDRFPLCSQTGTIAAFGSRFMTMRCSGYAFFDPKHPVATQDLVRLKFPGQDELLPDVPDNTPVSRAMFPKSEREGQINVDEDTGKVVVTNRIFGNYYIYDYSQIDVPRLLKEGKFRSPPNVPAFWRGKAVIPGGYSGLLLER